jgi:hypothetical protein
MRYSKEHSFGEVKKKLQYVYTRKSNIKSVHTCTLSAQPYMVQSRKEWVSCAMGVPLFTCAKFKNK